MATTKKKNPFNYGTYAQQGQVSGRWGVPDPAGTARGRLAQFRRGLVNLNVAKNKFERWAMLSEPGKEAEGISGGLTAERTQFNEALGKAQNLATKQQIHRSERPDAYKYKSGGMVYNPEKGYKEYQETTVTGSHAQDTEINRLQTYADFGGDTGWDANTMAEFQNQRGVHYERYMTKAFNANPEDAVKLVEKLYSWFDDFDETLWKMATLNGIMQYTDASALEGITYYQNTDPTAPNYDKYKYGQPVLSTKDNREAFALALAAANADKVSTAVEKFGMLRAAYYTYQYVKNYDTSGWESVGDLLTVSRTPEAAQAVSSIKSLTKQIAQYLSESSQVPAGITEFALEPAHPMNVDIVARIPGLKIADGTLLTPQSAVVYLGRYIPEDKLIQVRYNEDEDRYEMYLVNNSDYVDRSNIEAAHPNALVGTFWQTSGMWNESTPAPDMSQLTSTEEPTATELTNAPVVTPDSTVGPTPTATTTTTPEPTPTVTPTATPTVTPTATPTVAPTPVEPTSPSQQLVSPDADVTPTVTFNQSGTGAVDVGNINFEEGYLITGDEFTKRDWSTDQVLTAYEMETYFGDMEDVATDSIFVVRKSGDNYKIMQQTTGGYTLTMSEDAEPYVREVLTPDNKTYTFNSQEEYDTWVEDQAGMFKSTDFNEAGKYYNLRQAIISDPQFVNTDTNGEITVNHVVGDVSKTYTITTAEGFRDFANNELDTLIMMAVNLKDTNAAQSFLLDITHNDYAMVRDLMNLKNQPFEERLIFGLDNVNIADLDMINAKSPLIDYYNIVTQPSFTPSDSLDVVECAALLNYLSNGGTLEDFLANRQLIVDCYYSYYKTGQNIDEWKSGIASKINSGAQQSDYLTLPDPTQFEVVYDETPRFPNQRINGNTLYLQHYEKTPYTPYSEAMIQSGDYFKGLTLGEFYDTAINNNMALISASGLTTEGVNLLKYMGASDSDIAKFFTKDALLTPEQGNFGIFQPGMENIARFSAGIKNLWENLEYTLISPDTLKAKAYMQELSEVADKYYGGSTAKPDKAGFLLGWLFQDKDEFKSITERYSSWLSTAGEFVTNPLYQIPMFKGFEFMRSGEAGLTRIAEKSIPKFFKSAEHLISWGSEHGIRITAVAPESIEILGEHGIASATERVGERLISRVSNATYRIETELGERTVSSLDEAHAYLKAIVKPFASEAELMKYAKKVGAKVTTVSGETLQQRVGDNIINIPVQEIERGAGGRFTGAAIREPASYIIETADRVARVRNLMEASFFFNTGNVFNIESITSLLSRGVTVPILKDGKQVINKDGNPAYRVIFSPEKIDTLLRKFKWYQKYVISDVFYRPGDMKAIQKAIKHAIEVNDIDPAKIINTAAKINRAIREEGVIAARTYIGDVMRSSGYPIVLNSAAAKVRPTCLFEKGNIWIQGIDKQITERLFTEAEASARAEGKVLKLPRNTDGSISYATNDVAQYHRYYAFLHPGAHDMFDNYYVLLDGLHHLAGKFGVHYGRIDFQNVCEMAHYMPRKVIGIKEFEQVKVNFGDSTRQRALDLMSEGLDDGIIYATFTDTMAAYPKLVYNKIGKEYERSIMKALSAPRAIETLQGKILVSNLKAAKRIAAKADDIVALIRRFKQVPLLSGNDRRLLNKNPELKEAFEDLARANVEIADTSRISKLIKLIPKEGPLRNSDKILLRRWYKKYASGKAFFGEKSAVEEFIDFINGADKNVRKKVIDALTTRMEMEQRLNSSVREFIEGMADKEGSAVYWLNGEKVVWKSEDMLKNIARVKHEVERVLKYNEPVSSVFADLPKEMKDTFKGVRDVLEEYVALRKSLIPKEKLARKTAESAKERYNRQIFEYIDQRLSELQEISLGLSDKTALDLTNLEETVLRAQEEAKEVLKMSVKERNEYFRATNNPVLEHGDTLVNIARYRGWVFKPIKIRKVSPSTQIGLKGAGLRKRVYLKPREYAGEDLRKLVEEALVPHTERHLKFVSDIVRGSISLLTTLDLSAALTFGQLAASRPDKLVEAFGTSLMTLIHPRVVDYFEKVHMRTLNEGIQAGLKTVAETEDLYAGLGILNKTVGKVPVLGKMTLLPFARTGIAFTSFSEYARVLLWEVKRDSWIRAGGTLSELAEFCNLATFSLPSTLRPWNKNLLLIESIMAFAPNYYRSFATILWRMRPGTSIMGRELKKTLIKSWAVMESAYVAAWYATGNEGMPHISPLDPNYMKLEYNGSTYSIGGMFPGMTRTFAQTIQAMIAIAHDNPDKLFSISEEGWANTLGAWEDIFSPTWKFVKNRQTPLVNLINEMITRKNIFGERLESGNDYFEAMLGAFLPIVVQNIVLEDMPVSPFGLGASIFGINAYPVSLSKIAERYSDDFVKTIPSELLPDELAEKQEEGTLKWDDLGYVLQTYWKGQDEQLRNMWAQAEEESSKFHSAGYDEYTQQIATIEKGTADYENQEYNRLTSGEISTKDFWKNVAERRSDDSKLKDGVLIGHPDLAALFASMDATEDSALLDRAYGDYWDSVWGENVMDADGNIDWVKQSQALNEWRMRWRDENGVILSYVEEMSRMRYQGLPEIFLAMYDMKRELSDTYYKVPENQRDEWRQRPENAQYEAMIVFTGASTTIQNPAVEDIVREWCSDYGIDPDKTIPALINLQIPADMMEKYPIERNTCKREYSTLPTSGFARRRYMINNPGFQEYMVGEGLIQKYDQYGNDLFSWDTVPTEEQEVLINAYNNTPKYLKTRWRCTYQSGEQALIKFGYVSKAIYGSTACEIEMGNPISGALESMQNFNSGGE